MLLPVPDVLELCREPVSHRSRGTLRSLLLLLLGCAVQCDQKEAVIERIKSLDLKTQHSIVQCIQEVTDNPGPCWPLDWVELPIIPQDHQEPAFTLLVNHAKHLVGQRDNFYQQLLTQMIQQEIHVCGEEKSDPQKELSPGSSPPPAAATKLPNGTISPPDRQHLAVELADSKAKIRKLKQELEEKTENLSEAKEELDQVKEQLKKLREENLSLVQEGRSGKALRDELDIMRERALRVDRLEADVNKYREKVTI